MERSVENHPELNKTMENDTKWNETTATNDCLTFAHFDWPLFTTSAFAIIADTCGIGVLLRLQLWTENGFVIVLLGQMLNDWLHMVAVTGRFMSNYLPALTPIRYAYGIEGTYHASFILNLYVAVMRVVYVFSKQAASKRFTVARYIYTTSAILLVSYTGTISLQFALNYHGIRWDCADYRPHVPYTELTVWYTHVNGMVEIGCTAGCIAAYMVLFGKLTQRKGAQGNGAERNILIICVCGFLGQLASSIAWRTRVKLLAYIYTLNFSLSALLLLVMRRVRQFCMCQGDKRTPVTSLASSKSTHAKK